jgi:Rad3-related DNA helicase
MKDDFLTINFVDTDVIFRSISAKAKRVIISSGSLYPKHMAMYIGLNKSNSMIFEYNPPHKNRHNISSIIGSYGGVQLSTKYTNRKESVFKAYAEMVREVYQDNAHGTLVYFTSYAYRDKIGGYLKGWNIPYFEPDSVAEYRETIHAGKRAVFMSAFRGLGSEGWNFGDDQSRAIVLIGIPYLPTGELQVKAQQIYYNSRKTGLGNTWYNQKATLWLMQAFGRGLRHKDDFTTVFFADSRIPRMRGYFIGWVKEATNWKVKEWLNGRPKIRLQV